MTAARVDSQTAGETVRIAISGEIDIDNVTYVETEILAAVNNAALNNELSAVSVDLTNLTFMDTSGLHVMFRLAERLEARRARLELVAPPDSIARLLIKHSGLESVAMLRPTTTT